MLYLFNVYALVAFVVSTVVLGTWLVFYASLMGGVMIGRLLRMAANRIQGWNRPEYSGEAHVFDKSGIQADDLVKEQQEFSLRARKWT